MSGANATSELSQGQRGGLDTYGQDRNVQKGSDQAREGRGASKVVFQHQGYHQCKNYASGTEEFMGPREEGTTSDIFINPCHF